MRRLIGILFGALVVGWAAWSVWWFVSARAQQAGLETWLAAQRARGWQAEAAALDMSGYPTAYRLAIRGMALADPEAGWAWEAPALTAETDALSPTRVTVDWPPEQTLAVPGERMEIRTIGMQTLLDLRPGRALELREAASRLSGLTVEATTGWSAAADAAVVQIVERAADAAPPNSYGISVNAESVRLPKALVEEIDPTGWLQPKVDSLTVTGSVALAEPIGLATIEEGRMALRAASLREVGFRWGEMHLVVSGAFDVDAQGYPDGSIEVEAREWRQMIRLAVGSEIIDAPTGETITRAVEFVTALTGSGDSISVPLNLSGGKLRIGPFGIADVPRVAPPRD